MDEPLEPNQARSQTRPLTLLDIMALIAACAIAIPTSLWFLQVEDLRPLKKWAALVVCSPMTAFPIHLLLLILRLRAPRSPRQELCNQPGFVAAAVTVVSVLVLIANQSVRHYSYFTGRTPGTYREHVLETFAINMPMAACVAIAVGWSMLALNGRWSPERSWIDRLSRALGIYWLLLPTVTVCLGWRPLYCVW